MKPEKLGIAPCNMRSPRRQDKIVKIGLKCKASPRTLCNVKDTSLTVSRTHHSLRSRLLLKILGYPRI